ncbi:MAG: hypothetical protein ACK4E1_00030 [Fervidobacterium nodosum]
MGRKITSLLIMICSLYIFSNIISFNNTHLENIGEWFLLDGENVKGYWVYAENKGGKFSVIGAINEGDFCVDDAARVVLLYSEAYEITKEEKYLQLALDVSKFVLKMQASDGEFYNFAYKDGTVNKYGITSAKSAGWWALRAFWGLSKLAQFTKDENIRLAVDKTFNAIKRKPPTTADQIALYVLGLANYYKINKSQNVLNEIKKYADILFTYEIKDYQSLKGFFSVYKERKLWNGWGNHYAEAFIEAWRVTGEQKYLENAKRIVISQASVLIPTGLIYSIQNYIKLYPELAYSLEGVAVPLLKIYEITKDENIAYLSSLAVSWLYGGNRLGVRMYGENGEGFDGIEYMHYNRNSGAESTICSLRVILHAMKLPEKYQQIAIESGIIARSGINVLEAEAFDIGITSASIVTGDYASGAALRIDGKGRIKKTDIQPGDYYILVSGDFSNTVVSVLGKTNIKKTLNGKGLFEIGQLELESTIIVTNSDNCILDQVILVPTKLGVSFSEKGKIITAFNDINSGEFKIKEGQLFKAKSKAFSFRSTVEVKSFDEFYTLYLNEFFNNDGIATPQKIGNFDNLGGVVGAYLPAGELGEGINKINGIPFEIVVNGNDNIRCDGQTILLPKPINISKLYILAAANHGDYETTIFLDEVGYKVKINDWCNSPNGLVFDYRYVSSGEKQYLKCGISLYVFDINDEIEKIVLPEEINVHIFAITLKTN